MRHLFSPTYFVLPSALPGQGQEICIFLYLYSYFLYKKNNNNKLIICVTFFLCLSHAAAQETLFSGNIFEGFYQNFKGAPKKLFFQLVYFILFFSKSLKQNQK